MRPDGCAFLLPESNDAFRVVQGEKLAGPEAFVSDFPVDELSEPVLQGLSWRNEHPLCFSSPLRERFANLLGPPPLLAEAIPNA